MEQESASSGSEKMTPNGPGAAAVLATGVGCFAIGALAVAADQAPPLARTLIFYRPTGPLSGVSTVAIIAWLAVWAVLHYRWQSRDVNSGRIVAIAFVLLAAGVLLTFPPIGDLF
ncbi:hypothetical protein P8935_22465 [Telmatobacter sp. DSM 110680]|uniref:Uncharacterized protein n=1 Tax=Telmatobacter sp. DSM 110680 TaxID=3036704 RepID=A0AAU7DGY0_9BACT